MVDLRSKKKNNVQDFGMDFSDEERDTPQRKRPSTVTFNVEYEYPNQRRNLNTSSASRRKTKNIISRPQTTKTKTADVSHITDKKHQIRNIPSFIPDEYRREITTPTPLRPGVGSLDVAENKWRTQVFPTESGDSRDEVAMLSEWLNSVLEKNQEESDDDPLKMAANARHWFGIAFDELCRQVSFECQERAQLLSSIWRRYQSLFQRVAQLHIEERQYLINCHKERTAILKAELENTQSKLKKVSQHYRDDQERWSNSRERDESKFTNMRKKLDLQVKNKRNLTLKIKALKEKLGHGPSIEDMKNKNDNEIEVNEEEDTSKNDEITPAQMSEKVKALRQRIRNDYSYMTQMSSSLDDIAHYLDQDREPNKSIRDLYPNLFKALPISHAGNLRSLQWLMSIYTIVYSFRIIDLCDHRFPFPYQTNRLHFVDSIFGFFLRTFGTPYQSSEVFFDLVLTSKKYAEKGYSRAKMFLKFIDCSDEYLDSIFLDFYCFCVGCFNSMQPETRRLFPDKFSEENPEIGLISSRIAIDFCKKVYYAMSESDIAEKYLQQTISHFHINEQDQEQSLSLDDIIEYMINIYKIEEQRVADQLKEQYEMDAAQYGGIITLSQFQTLSMFSPKQLDFRAYTKLMSDAFQKNCNKSIKFSELIQELHDWAMLVPFVFDRIEYDINNQPSDILNFMENEFKFHQPDYDAKLEKIRKADDSLYQSLIGTKTKFRQLLETGRTGPIIEIAQREFYEKMSSVEIE